MCFSSYIGLICIQARHSQRFDLSDRQKHRVTNNINSGSFLFRYTNKRRQCAGVHDTRALPGAHERICN